MTQPLDPKLLELVIFSSFSPYSAIKGHLLYYISNFIFFWTATSNVLLGVSLAPAIIAPLTTILNIAPININTNWSDLKLLISILTSNLIFPPVSLVQLYTLISIVLNFLIILFLKCNGWFYSSPIKNIPSISWIVHCRRILDKHHKPRKGYF